MLNQAVELMQPENTFSDHVIFT